MQDELTPLINTLQGVLEHVSPTGRRELAKEIARGLRGSQAKRIKENIDPSGQTFEPRKPQHSSRQRQGSIKRKMFQKLIRMQWLKSKANTNEATVQFVGFARRIARVSQYGLRDRIHPGIEAQYPKRELLGLTDKEKDQIEDLILGYIDKIRI
jgi:phage virion morphogenesis protein